VKYIVLLLAAIGSTLSAQTLSLTNNSNGALGMDFVSGDTAKIEITGAAPDRPVTLSMWRNGVLESSNWLAGYTDGAGHFVSYTTETDDFIAEFYEQWYVDGNDIGDFLDFEVMYKPSSLEVTAVDVAALPPQCSGTYGISIDVTFQIRNPNGQSVSTSTGIPMVPYEDVGFQHGNIGPVSGYPTSSLYAAGNGTFHDVPLGVCGNYPFNVNMDNQNIYVYIGDNAYSVRSNQVYSVAGPTPGHGSISNGSDVTKSR
jgi:hypothetical protein